MRCNRKARPKVSSLCVVTERLVQTESISYHALDRWDSKVVEMAIGSVLMVMDCFSFFYHILVIHIH